MIISAGTNVNMLEVAPWQDITFPWTITSSGELDMFLVSYPVADLLQHDQGKGKNYVFSLKAFNRAGHHILVTSDEFSVQVPPIPKTFLLYHVDKTNFSEIYYQKEVDYLCGKWIGSGNQENVSLGVGTIPGNDDVIQFVTVPNNGIFCFNNLSLVSMVRYYLVISTDNGLTVTETSKGIFVGKTEDIYYQSRVNNGLDCRNTEPVVIGSNISLSDAEPVIVDFEIPLSGWMKKTMVVTINTTHFNDNNTIDASINGQDLEMMFLKENSQQVQLYYSFDAKTVNNTLKLSTRQQKELKIETIDVFDCIQDSPSKEYTTQLHTNFNFRGGVQTAVSHFEVAFYLIQSNLNGTTEIPLTQYFAVGKDTQFMHSTSLGNHNVYITKVKPCFVTQCLTPVQSSGTILVMEPPVYGMISASMQHSNRSMMSHNYVLEAEWDVFLELTATGYIPVDLYDWAVALDEDGTNLLTQWQRISANHSETIQVNHSALVYQ